MVTLPTTKTNSFNRVNGKTVSRERDNRYDTGNIREYRDDVWFDPTMREQLSVVLSKLLPNYRFQVIGQFAEGDTGWSTGARGESFHLKLKIHRSPVRHPVTKKMPRLMVVGAANIKTSRGAWHSPIPKEELRNRYDGVIVLYSDRLAGSIVGSAPCRGNRETSNYVRVVPTTRLIPTGYPNSFKESPFLLSEASVRGLMAKRHYLMDLSNSCPSWICDQYL